MADISVPWGRDELTIELPEAWTVRQVAQPQLRQASDGWQQRIARALSQPDSGLPLGRLLAARSGGRIAILVEDLTRHSPLPEILEPVLREIHHARVPDENIEIVFCTGMHADMTCAQAREKIGDLAYTLRWRCNPWTDPSRYVRVGRVEKLDIAIDRDVAQADLRIVISSVSPHLQAGFGGGCKMLFPGCASLETIRGLHRLGLGRQARQLVGTPAMLNPMRATIEHAGKLVDAWHGTTFGLQYLLDERNLPAYVASGNPADTQGMLAKQCSVACGAMIEEPADVVITNAHPRDFDLWQSFKGIANAQWAARPGGVILCLTRCQAGLNDMSPPRWPISPAWTRRIIRLLGPEALASLLTRAVPALAGDAAFFVRMGLQTIHRNPVLFVSPKLAEAGRFPGVDIFAEPADAIHAAQAIVGTGPQRVNVFPSGGITYPIPRSVTSRAGRGS